MSDFYVITCVCVCVCVLQDAAFRRLTFTAMLAWQRPYLEDLYSNETNNLPVSKQDGCPLRHPCFSFFLLICTLSASADQSLIHLQLSVQLLLPFIA